MRLKKSWPFEEELTLLCSGDDDDGGDDGGDGGDDGGDGGDGGAGSTDGGGGNDATGGNQAAGDDGGQDRGPGGGTDSGGGGNDATGGNQGSSADGGGGPADAGGGPTDAGAGPADAGPGAPDGTGPAESALPGGSDPGADIQASSLDTRAADSVGGPPDSALGPGGPETGGTQGVSSDVGAALDAAGQEPAPAPTNTDPNAINAPDMTVDPTIPAPTIGPRDFMDPAFIPPGQAPDTTPPPGVPTAPTGPTSIGGITPAASPAAAAAAAGLPGGVSSISDILAGQTPVAAALSAASSPTDQVIANAQNAMAGQPGQTANTQLAANTNLGDILGVGVSQPGMGNLPGGATGPATSPALDTFGGQLGTIPGAFNQSGLDAMRTLDPTGGIQGPSLDTVPADQPGGVPGGRLGMGPDATGGIQDPSIVGGGPPGTGVDPSTVNRDLKGDFGGPPTGVDPATVNRDLKGDFQTAQNMPSIQDPNAVQPGQQDPSIPLPTARPSTTDTVATFMDQPGGFPPLDTPAPSVPLPTPRPDSAPQAPPAQVAGPSPIVDTTVSPISSPVSPDVQQALSTADGGGPGPEIFSGSTLSDTGGGGTGQGGAGPENSAANLAAQITAPPPAADGGSPPPADGGSPAPPFSFQFPGFGDEGNPAGNFNPEEGLWGPAASPGGPALLPGGVAGPVPVVSTPVVLEPGGNGPLASGGQRVGGTTGGSSDFTPIPDSVVSALNNA